MKASKIFILGLILCLVLSASLFAKSWNVIEIDRAKTVIPGESVNLSINLNRGGFEIGDFRLSIYYDPTAVTFDDAILGDIFTAANWEFFEYSTEVCGNCPYNIINIHAVADYYDDGNTPTQLTGPGEIAQLQFTTFAEDTLECVNLPIGFYWDDCQDNAFMNTKRDTVWLSDYVFDFSGDNITKEPYFGGAGNNCLDIEDAVPFRFLDFKTGGIDFSCPPPYMCGDINGDDKINLLDPIYLVNYLFRSGPAPNPWERGDVNYDQEVNINDLVYIVDYIFNHGADPICE